MEDESAEKTEENTKLLNECSVCGYVYKTEEGDRDGEIPAGTEYDELPGNWVCPICGATKEYFRKKAYK